MQARTPQKKNTCIVTGKSQNSKICTQNKIQMKYLNCTKGILKFTISKYSADFATLSAP